jgi:hypothetical protein
MSCQSLTKRGTQCKWKGPRCPNHTTGAGITPSRMIPSKQQIQEAKATFIKAVKENQLAIATQAYQFLIGQAGSLSSADHAALEQWSRGH